VFFVALLINSKVDTNKDKGTFRTIIKSVNIEAAANQKISAESFRKNFQRVVCRGFSYRLSEDFLGDRIFLSNASDSLIHYMNEYILNLKRANAFMQAQEQFRNIPAMEKRWGGSLRMGWTPVLDKCDSIIHLLIIYTDSILLAQ
jgi:hypothetical protein